MTTSPPGTSPYGEDGIPKGWSSERHPLSGYRSRRSAAALMPFSSGRALPSKWDDAERWISSPVSVGNAAPNNYYTTGGGGGGIVKSTSLQPGLAQKRAKSKSGPLGPGRLNSYGSFNGYGHGYGFSPVLGMGVINGGKWRNSLMIESPGLIRGRLGDGSSGGGGGGGGGGGDGGGRRSLPGHGGPDWFDLWSDPPSPSNKANQANLVDENDDDHNRNGEDGLFDGAISRRDMATQMLQESGNSEPSSAALSSPRSSVLTNSPRSLLLNDEPNMMMDIARGSESDEVRDVQVDKQTSTATAMSSSDDNGMEEKPFRSTNMEANKEVSRLEREEAKINAWENLQKAKAEAAIQKLEMKLEKKRSSSLEKIMEKLRRAEIKADKMRNSVTKDDDQSRVVLRTTSKLPSFCRKIRISSSIRSCSTCYPF